MKFLKLLILFLVMVQFTIPSIAQENTGPTIPGFYIDFEIYYSDNHEGFDLIDHEADIFNNYYAEITLIFSGTIRNYTIFSVHYVDENGDLRETTIERVALYTTNRIDDSLQVAISSDFVMTKPVPTYSTTKPEPSSPLLGYYLSVIGLVFVLIIFMPEIVSIFQSKKMFCSSCGKSQKVKSEVYFNCFHCGKFNDMEESK